LLAATGLGFSRRIGRDAAFAEFVEMEMTPGSSVTDDASVKRAIFEQLDVYHHPTSTAPMGLEGSGVVDAFGRVYGLRGLMVVDASIMPFVPSAPTNLTTIMIAEHVARHCLVPA
jgi:choline dehydrogenase-like flavoprotein